MDILLVEDDALVMETLTEGLRLAGLAFDPHANAESAIAAASVWRPRAVVTDINLGRGMDGITLGRVLRARHVDLPVVYISGRYGELRGLSSHERFFLKPFHVGHLLRCLGELDVKLARDLAI